MNKKRILFGILVIIIVITGFALKKKPGDTTETVKSDFIIETMAISSISGATLTKNGKVEGLSDITLTAQTAGRVSSINEKNGTEVSKGMNIVRLEDTQGSNTFRAENSEVAVVSAENNFEIQKKNLEKQIQDLLLAKEKAQISYNNTAGGDINNTLLQIESLKKNLEKARLDYENKLSSDDVTLQNNVASAKNIYTDTMNLLIDVIDQGDKLLKVSPTATQYYTNYDIYVGGKDIHLQNKAKDELRELFRVKANLLEVGNNITLENIDTFLQKYKEVAQAINNFTITMKNVFANSLTDSSAFPQSQLDALAASFGAVQTKSSAIVASITTQTNALTLFVQSYKPNQQSLAKQIEILENDIIVKQNQLEEAAKNSELNLKSSEGNYNFAVDTKDLNLQNIENSLELARVALREAQFNVAKLSINAPIKGIISDILVDVGQEVSMGTPIARLVSEGKGIKVSLTEKELVGISVGQQVTIKSELGEGIGSIVSIGVVGDKNGNFPVEVYIEDGEFSIGSFVDVSIRTDRGSSVIPLNAVSIIDNNIGQVIVWDGKELLPKQVDLGLILGEYVEIKSQIESQYQIVVTDTTNYDKEKMTVKLK